MAELLSASDIRVAYGGREAVRGVSFTLERGQVCALLGANGSGKSTLLRAVCGLLPFSGRCLLEGESPAAMSARQRARRIGYLAQRSSPGLALSALETVLLGFNPLLGLLERPGPALRDRALAVMEQVGVAQHAHTSFDALSEGQRQLVLVARTLVRDTRLTVLDEPDSALDFPNRHRVMQLLTERVRQGGQAFLLSSHDANFALRYADRLLLLRDGALAHDLPLGTVDADSLRDALRDIYGPVEVLTHKGVFLMTGGDDT